MKRGWRLYADVGNSALKWAARAEDAWRADGRLPRESLDAAALVAALGQAGLNACECERVALVSSRPVLAAPAEALLSEVTGVPVLMMGRDLHADLTVAYHDPAEIGQDRLAAAEGARALVGTPVIIVTLGTCLTAQALSTEGVLVGGAIAAGLEAQVAGIATAVPHLAEAAARALARLRAGGVTPLVGRSTAENLAVGLRAELCGAIEVLVGALHAEVGETPVVATGGDADVAVRAGARFDRVEPLLVLEGLRVADERYDAGH